jgi:hypothetical protein
MRTPELSQEPQSSCHNYYSASPVSSDEESGHIRASFSSVEQVLNLKEEEIHFTGHHSKREHNDSDSDTPLSESLPNQRNGKKKAAKSSILGDKGEPPHTETPQKNRNQLRRP